MASQGFVASAVAASALALVACNAVFGLDAPTLAADGGTGDDAAVGSPEAGTDAPVTGGDAASDGTVDSGVRESGSDAPQPDSGIRCGGGGYPLTYCTGATPHCCQGGTVAAPTFTCVADAGACNGYDITCADYSDCTGSEICCHFMAHQVCDVATKCPNNELVCTTAMTDSCPTGWTCSVPFVGDASAQSPYLGCTQ